MSIREMVDMSFVRGWRAPVVRRDPLAGRWFITRWNPDNKPKGYELCRLGRVMGLLEPGRLLVKEIFCGFGDDYPPGLRIVSSKDALRDEDDADEAWDRREEVWAFFATRRAFLREYHKLWDAEVRREAGAPAVLGGRGKAATI